MVVVMGYTCNRPLGHVWNNRRGEALRLYETQAVAVVIIGNTNGVEEKKMMMGMTMMRRVSFSAQARDLTPTTVPL